MDIEMRNELIEILGTEENDSLRVTARTAVDYTISTLGGDDFIVFRKTNPAIFSDVRIDAGDGNDRIYVFGEVIASDSPFDDSNLTGGVLGGAGNDYIFVRDNGEVSVNAGEGNDIVRYSFRESESSQPLIALGDGDDRVIIEAENEYNYTYLAAYGGAGDDHFIVDWMGGGQFFFIGNEGRNRFDISGNGMQLEEVSGGSDRDVFNYDVNWLGWGNTYGNGGDDRFQLVAQTLEEHDVNGNDGDDYISLFVETINYYGIVGGGAGNDIISVTDADLLEVYGGDGADSIYLREAIIQTNVTTSIVDGGGGDDRVFGNSHGNRLSGGEGEDRLYGRDGDDILNGDLENDFLVGGAGDDMLIGGGGNDRLLGGDGTDTASYEGDIADYTIIVRPSGLIEVSDASGHLDRLSDVEQLQFGDLVYSYDGTDWGLV